MGTARGRVRFTTVLAALFLVTSGCSSSSLPEPPPGRAASAATGAPAASVAPPPAAASATTGVPAAPLPAAARSSRLVVTADALWAGHAASKTVSKLALPAGTRVWQTAVGCEPGTLASSGPRLYAACVDTGEVVLLDASTGAIVRRARVGHGAFGLLLAGPRLYVTLEHDDELVALRPDTLAVEARAKTGREPRGLALRSGVLYVVHYLDASVMAFELGSLRPSGSGSVGPRSVFAESLTPSPQADRLYVPHQRQNTDNFDRKFNNTVFPLVTPLEASSLSPIRREELALDSVDTPVGLPIASVIDPSGSRLYVANALSSDVSVVDLASGFRLAHVLVGDHPREIALSPDGALLYTLNVVSDDVSVVDTASEQVVKTLPLATDPRPRLEKQGQRLFMVSRPETLSRDRWITCASCHLDGGNDGQVWLGEPFGPRNTPILRGIKGTQPFHWSGDFPRIQDANPFIQGQLGGTGISDGELEALAAFIESLTPLASARRTADGTLTPDAVRGAAVFRGADCVRCHVAPLMTDRQLRDVGTGDPFYDAPGGGGKLAEKRGGAYKTPPLRELWLTAPYLHDGRAKTLRDVLTTFNKDDHHGTTSGLSEGDLNDLEAFLLSLPLTEGDRRQLGTP